MLSRWTYIERGATIAALAIAPWVTILTISGETGSLALADLVMRFAMVASVLALLGAGLSLLLHKRLAVRGIEWGGYDETAALLKQAGSELVSGKPDEKLLGSANRQADNQDGRATSLYLYNRMAQLRQQDSFRRKTRPNPVPTAKRLIWTFLLALMAGAILVWPSSIAAQLTPTTHLIVGLALTPFFLTAVMMLGLGLRSADAWLYKIAGLRTPARSTVKLRKREVRSVAGQWHVQNRGPDIPLFRVVLGVVCLIAIGLYMLREYDDVIFKPEPVEVATAPETVDQARPQPVSTPRPQATAQPRPRTASTPTPRPRPREPQVRSADLWKRLGGNGTLVQADPTALGYAGWSIDSLRQAFARYKQDRLDEWYILHVREHPHDAGKVTFRLTLQPFGNVSDIQLVASQIGDSTFTNGLIDRLEAIELGSTALDPVSVTLAYDFRL